MRKPLEPLRGPDEPDGLLIWILKILAVVMAILLVVSIFDSAMSALASPRSPEAERRLSEPRAATGERRRCHTHDDTVRSLNAFTTQRKTKATALRRVFPKDARWSWIYITFSDNVEITAIEMFYDGCLVVSPINGELRPIFKINDKMRLEMMDSEVIFENGGESPVRSY